MSKASEVGQFREHPELGGDKWERTFHLPGFEPTLKEVGWVSALIVAMSTSLPTLQTLDFLLILGSGHLPAPPPPCQVFPKAQEPDEPQFYLGTILLFPFLSCALVLETMWVWLPVGHLQKGLPHSSHILGLWVAWAKQDSVLPLAVAPGFCHWVLWAGGWQLDS